MATTMREFESRMAEWRAVQDETANTYVIAIAIWFWQQGVSMTNVRRLHQVGSQSSADHHDQSQRRYLKLRHRPVASSMSSTQSPMLVVAGEWIWTSDLLVVSLARSAGKFNNTRNACTSCANHLPRDGNATAGKLSSVMASEGSAALWDATRVRNGLLSRLQSGSIDYWFQRESLVKGARNWKLDRRLWVPGSKKREV